MSTKICERGCGKYIIFLGKIQDKQGSTGWFEVEDGKITQTEHSYARCDRLIASQQKTEDEIVKNKVIHGGGLDSFNII